MTFNKTILALTVMVAPLLLMTGCTSHTESSRTPESASDMPHITNVYGFPGLETVRKTTGEPLNFEYTTNDSVVVLRDNTNCNAAVGSFSLIEDGTSQRTDSYALSLPSDAKVVTPFNMENTSVQFGFADIGNDSGKWHKLKDAALKCKDSDKTGDTVVDDVDTDTAITFRSVEDYHGAVVSVFEQLHVSKTAPLPGETPARVQTCASMTNLANGVIITSRACGTAGVQSVSIASNLFSEVNTSMS